MTSASWGSLGAAVNWRAKKLTEKPRQSLTIPLRSSSTQNSQSVEVLENMVSAAGFEPATHALKGHCSTT
jgi:hypothetical protein